MKRIVNGLLVLDKPTGITSRDAVDRALKWFPKRTKIGHTGTLDPLATGVLVLCLGSATRLAEYVQAMDKVYETTMILGARSDTDDADGTITPTSGISPLREAEVRLAVNGFVGEIAQTPPAYSAVKIDGKRAHELARRGDEVVISARAVRVYRISVHGYNWPELHLEVHCGKGTYIRSLARDLGERLGCGAYVQKLRRIRVGTFTVDGAVTLESSAAQVMEHLRPGSAAVAHLPSIEVDAVGIDVLRHGQPIPILSGFRGVADSEVVVFDVHGQLIGIGRFDEKGDVWPVKTFPPQ